MAPILVLVSFFTLIFLLSNFQKLKRTRVGGGHFHRAQKDGQSWATSPSWVPSPTKPSIPCRKPTARSSTCAWAPSM
ncbi:hypothetical protein HPP92_018231 [Vanilla planifolia]|uniref:ATP synthase F0 subunit 8 n=1 Tax=Vanilla planifolia TaxID=51239 RepID=A0A835Q9I2_VANPL|nr:hypothetical protein HPP92_018231 [Vanilla planifolia]